MTRSIARLSATAELVVDCVRFETAFRDKHSAVLYYPSVHLILFALLSIEVLLRFYFALTQQC